MSTQTEVKHTPTPWKIKNLTHNDLPVYAVMNSQGQLIAEVPAMDEIDKANAAFIVRAVNCHEDLFKACKKVRDMVSAVCHCDPLTPGLTKAERTCDFCLAGNILKQAIAKAESR